jgi:hypothetical protein
MRKIGFDPNDRQGERYMAGCVRYVPFLLLTILTTAALPFRFPWQEEENEIKENKRTREVAPTYLDTLNRGNELHVSNSDFEDTPVAVAPERPVSQNPSKKSEQAAQAGGEIGNYRIQCMASQSLEGVRKEKLRMEQELGLPLYIVYSPPFYRLHAGAFDNREEAENHLERVQKNGYPEAWVVKSDAEPLN